MNIDQSKNDKTSNTSTAAKQDSNINSSQTSPLKLLRTSKPFSTNSIEFFLRFGDIISIIIAAIISFIVYGDRITDEMNSAYINIAAISLFITSLTIQSSGGYDSQAYFSIKSSLKSALLGWSIAILLLLMAGFSFKVTDAFSRLWIGNWVISAAILITGIRFIIWLISRELRKKNTFDSRAIIVGAGHQGQELCKYLQNNDTLTISVIGFADDRSDRTPKTIGDIPVIGGLDKLKNLIQAGEVDQVLVSLPWSAKERLRQIVDSISENPVKIRLAPDLAAFEYLNRDFTSLGGLPVMNLFDRPISGIDSLLKTIEDYILGALFLIVALPIMAIIAIAIKLDSKGPIFFQQDREGYNNNIFKVWKFRSMNVTEGDEITQVSATDKRVTRVGAFLRRTSLDELPQLLNILKGEMSLVGPRPHAPSTKAAGIKFEKAVARYAARHRVKPGITGWAQVNGWRGETDTVEKLEQRLHHDLYYIDHWSIGLDLQILIKTLFVAWSQDTAY